MVDECLRRIGRLSQMIHLMAEHAKDIIVMQLLFKQKFPHVKIRPYPPPPKKGGISWLAKNVEKLIITALENRKSKHDCIVVLHDADLQTRPHGRNDYEKVALICKKYRDDVIFIIAYDELEAWLLADSGLAQALNRKPKNYDNEIRPSKILNKWLEDTGRKHLTDEKIAIIEQILKGLDGTGDQHSPSLQAALKKLHDHDCLNEDTQKRL